MTTTDTVRVKICGITRLEDALAALDAGTDLLGFNFYPQSSRYIEPERAAGIICALPPDTLSVGLFVNANLDTVQAVIRRCSLRFVQIHGDEPPDYLEALTPLAYKGARPRSQDEAEEVLALYEPLGPADKSVPCLLLDAYHPQHYGGTGQVGNWQMAATVASRCRLMLAGGLTPENVADAVRQVRPWGVDIASGVEVSAGIKDSGKMQAFVQAAKGVAIADQ